MAKAAAKIQLHGLRSLASVHGSKVPDGTAEPQKNTAENGSESSTKRFNFAAVSWSPGTAQAVPGTGTLDSEPTGEKVVDDPSSARTKRDRVSEQEISYSIVIAGFARRGRPNVAAMFLEAMVEHGISPNVFVFNAVIAAFAGHADVAEAASWLRRMKEHGVQPNVMTITSLIDACAKAGEAAEAVRWFRVIDEMGLRPNAVSYNAVINAFARRGDCFGAMDWLERMQHDVEPDQVSYNSVLHSCALSKEPRAKEAEQIFKRMSSRSVPPNAVTLGSLAQAVGTDRRNNLCAELQIDVAKVLQSTGKRTHRKVKPLGLQR